jgi:drug/metabolite transporter (DMT)-like permease
LPLGITKLISGAAAVIGVALLLTDGYLAQLASGDTAIYGTFLSIACAARASVYMVLAKPIITEYGMIRITTISLIIGAVALWIIVGLFWNTWVDPLTLFDKEPMAAWSLLTLGIWNTTIAQVLWFGGLAAVLDITRGSYLFFLKPVITALLALAILAQPITAVQIIAIIIICSSVLIELFWNRISELFGRSQN